MDRITFIKQNTPFLTRVYIIITLATAAFFSVITYSIIPLILLLGYAYLWWRPVRPVIHLMVDYFILFALAILFFPTAGVFSVLVTLPVFLLLYDGLFKTAASFHPLPGEGKHQVTNTGFTLFPLTVAVLISALLLDNLSLIITAVIALVCLSVLYILDRKRISSLPLDVRLVEQRMVAGTQDVIFLRFKVNNKWCGNILLQSTYEWLKISPDFISLRKADEIGINITLTPPLAGPSSIKLGAYFTDCWGLVQSHYEITPIKLYVIPRARYAAWLARKYLEGTGAGTLPLISALRPFQLQNAIKRGIEYYGNRPYYPGDSLKTIDWKHSLKFNELISKDFREFNGQAALTLVNLAVGTAEDADMLAYNIITVALSLAQENIPAVITAYDQEKVTSISRLLSHQNLVTSAMETAQKITFLNDVQRYLAAPDITHLRANISRIRSSQSPPAAILGQLLQMEYTNMALHARHNPATEAISRASFFIGKEFTVITISQHNHDSDALAFADFACRQQGHATIEVTGVAG